MTSLPYFGCYSHWLVCRLCIGFFQNDSNFCSVLSTSQQLSVEKKLPSANSKYKRERLFSAIYWLKHTSKMLRNKNKKSILPGSADNILRQRFSNYGARPLVSCVTICQVFKHIYIYNLYINYQKYITFVGVLSWNYMSLSFLQQVPY